MRAIDLIVIHCSSTRENYALTEQALEASHRLIGFDGTGYHFYVRRDGRVLATRPVSKVGAHARGYNAHSIGICYEGGLDRYGNPKDTRTEWQRHSLSVLVGKLLQDYPGYVCSGAQGPQSRPERQRRDRTRRVDKGVSLLRCGCDCAGSSAA